MNWLGSVSASHFSKRSGLKDLKNTYDRAMVVSSMNSLFVREGKGGMSCWCRLSCSQHY
jgi:hypothetical protein